MLTRGHHCLLSHRALAFLSNNFAGVVSKVTLTNPDVEFLALIARELKEYTAHLEKLKYVICPSDIPYHFILFYFISYHFIPFHIISQAS